MKAASMAKVQRAIWDAGIPVRIAKFMGRYVFMSKGTIHYTEIRCLWWGQLDWWVDQARYSHRISSQMAESRQANVPGKPAL